MALLLLYAHPDVPRSRVNAALRTRAGELPGVTVHDLYARYPDFFVDVPREQALLQAHDTIVLQHPFHWYGVPALAKLWIDEVLARGWAYGPGGTRLAGKRWAHAISAGGAAAAYGPGGGHGFTMTEFLRPLERTAGLCGMHWLEPFVVHSADDLSDDALSDAARRYRAWVAALAGAPGS